MFLRELSEPYHCNSESNLLTKYGYCFPSEISVVVDLLIISIPKAYLFLQPYNTLITGVCYFQNYFGTFFCFTTFRVRHYVKLYIIYVFIRGPHGRLVLLLNVLRSLNKVYCYYYYNIQNEKG